MHFGNQVSHNHLRKWGNVYFDIKFGFGDVLQKHVLYNKLFKF